MQDPLRPHSLQRTHARRTRLPITPNLLHQLLPLILNNKDMCKYDRLVYATAISIAYFGCLRGGELSYPSIRSYNPRRNLTLSDISIHNNSIVLLLKQSKTDQLGVGSRVIIGETKQEFCPVKLARRFLQYKQNAPQSDAAFRLKDGSLLTRPRLQTILRKSLTMLNLPAQHFGTHSLRIGSATAAAEAGVPVDTIKTMGRWSSDCYQRDRSHLWDAIVQPSSQPLAIQA